METTTLKIRLPKSHAKQVTFKRSLAKRKVICAGRRGGKTTGIAALAVEAMLAGWRVLEAAPTADQTEAFWAACKAFLAEPIAAGVVYKNETERILELPTVPLVKGYRASPVLEKAYGVIPRNPRIRTKTAHDADSLRGDYADLLILDEYSIMDPSTWSEVGAPMLLDNDGDAVFIFTPKRRNHAFRLYAQAVADGTGRWQAFHFTSYDNPHLSKAALEEITRDMTEESYKQEILAEFLEGEGAVFRNIPACLHAPSATPADHEGHRIIAGCDWAKQSDYTCFAFGCADCRVEVDRDRFNRIDYAFQAQRLAALCEKWQPESVLTELNSIGQPVFEQLERLGLPVVGFETTASSKPPLIENMALTLEKAEWQFQSDPIWTNELEAYERKVSANTGRSSYSAPDGMNDDTIIARALMLWQARQPDTTALRQARITGRPTTTDMRKAVRRSN